MAFLALIAFAVAWFVFDRKDLNWQGYGTLLTLLMTILITRSQNRDTAALQAKLNELIRVTDGARDEIAEVDELATEELREVSQAVSDGA